MRTPRNWSTRTGKVTVCRGMTFVVVEPPLEHQHACSFKLAHDHVARVAGDGGNAESAASVA